MGTTSQQNRVEPSIIGHSGRLGETAPIARWTPLSEAEVNALPLPPPPSVRGWRLPEPAPAAAGRTESGATARSGRQPSPPSILATEEQSEPLAAGPTVESSRERPARPSWIADDSVQALAWENPTQVAGIVRSLLRDGKRSHEAAILCAGLGLEVTAEVLRQLTETEVDKAAEAIAVMSPVPDEVSRMVLEELRQRLESGQPAASGGIGFAQAAIARALGPRKALEVIDRLGARTFPGWDLLSRAQADQVAPFISHEHPQTIALILSQLESPLAAGILCLLPEPIQAEVSWRMATLEAVPPVLLRHIWEAMEQSLREVLAGTLGVGGPKVVADVLNLSGPGVEKRVLETLDQRSPELGDAVRNLMFVFDDIGKLSDQEIQVLLHEVDQRDLAISLKAATDELRNKLLANVSEQVRETVTQEVECLGPMRLREVEQVQLRIVQLVRRLEVEGRITIVRGDIELFV